MGFKKKSRQRAYTLVEMVMAILILSILGSVAALAIVESMKVYARTAPAIDASFQTEWALERMKREIRDLQDTNGISVFTANAFTFVDIKSNTIAYSLSGTDLMRNSDILAQGVNALTFSYFAKDGTIAATAADLHLVQVDLTVQTGNEPFHMIADVFPRSLTEVLYGAPGGSGQANPLNETASQATAVWIDPKKAEINLISEVSYALVVESFELSADRAMPKLKELKLNGKKVWKEGNGVSLPTGVQALNKGTAGERTIPANGSVTAQLKFKDPPTTGPAQYTLVVHFTDGTSSTLVFTITW